MLLGGLDRSNSYMGFGIFVFNQTLQKKLKEVKLYKKLTSVQGFLTQYTSSTLFYVIRLLLLDNCAVSVQISKR